MYAATIGFFDGVHLGHRCLVGQLCEAARQRGLRSLVVTFESHPRQVIGDEFVPRLLTTTSEKLPLLRQTGVDEIEVLHFDREMSLLPARDFMRMLRDRMGVEALVMGYDHRFGHDCGQGLDYETIAHGEGLDLVRAYELPGLRASSSAVRRHLLGGELGEANRILGYAYRLGGIVVHGKGLGRQLGFPTANVSVVREKLIPACGVYAVWVTLPDGSRHKGMLNIGNRPTMDDFGGVSTEVYLLDFEGSLYGESLSMELIARLRDEHRFPSPSALASQLMRDASEVRALLS